MTWLYGFLLLTAIDTVAHVLFKVTALRAAPLEASAAWLVRALGEASLYGAVACYVATFFVWMTLLRRAPVGPAFAASHLDVVTVMMASTLLLNEHVTPLQIAGAGLILAGIGCLSLCEARDARAPSS